MFTDPAGAHGDGFGLMFDCIHRTGEIINRTAQTFKHLIQHIGGGTLLAEIELKVRDRQSAG